jgi:hypothetical protein
VLAKTISNLPYPTPTRAEEGTEMRRMSEKENESGKQEFKAKKEEDQF